MTMLTWKDEYSVDIEEIDAQHQRLVELINETYLALARKDNHEQVEKVLNEMVEYTKVHFAVEECLLRMFDYPEYDAHKAIHDSIVARVLQFQGQFRAGNNQMGMELLNFLKDWLFDHINKVDKRYSGHLQKGGVRRKWLKKFW